MYAQNWEDPRLELQALDVQPHDRVLAIAGGGCTALSLLAEGPVRLEAVDQSRAQLEMLELKCKTVCDLTPDGANEFLVANGILDRGRAEKAIGAFRWIIRTLIHSRERIEELFALDSLANQVRFYHRHWNNRRWQWLFHMVRKGTFDRALDPAFYQHVAPGNLGRQLHLRAEHCLTQMPVRENYFLSRILLGGHLRHPEGRPPYLQPRGVEGIRRNRSRLGLHRMGLLDYLRGQPDASFDKLYLSNVGEWLAERERIELFGQVVRVSRPGTRVCWRALMVERPLPQAFRDRIIVDVERSTELGRQDRAFLNASFTVARVAR